MQHAKPRCINVERHGEFFVGCIVNLECPRRQQLKQTRRQSHYLKLHP